MTITKAILSMLLISATMVAGSPAKADDGDVIGAIIGGGIGAILGDELSNGDTTATVLGAVAGAIIGHEIGEDLDRDDRYEAERATHRALYAPIGHRHTWRGRHGYGEIIIVNEYYTYYGDYCREYTSEVFTPNGSRLSRGVTCQDRYGRWTQWYQPTIIRNSYRRPHHHRYDHYDHYDRYDRRDRRHRRHGR